MSLAADYLESSTAHLAASLEEAAADAEAVDVAVETLSAEVWQRLRPLLASLAARGATLRLVVPKTLGRTCPRAVAEYLQLPGAQAAFGPPPLPGDPQDYFFYAEGGARLTVVSSAIGGIFPDLDNNASRAAIVRLRMPEDERAIRHARERFELRFLGGEPIRQENLARFRELADGPELREGDLVRSTNPLFRDYGVGRVQKARGGSAKVEYNPSVFMRPPYRSENKILNQAELERIETPLDRARRGAWGEPWRLELKLQAARFLTGNKGGQLSNARTEILPHQIFAAHRVVSSPLRRFLLADEVGLGKTIEAGMIWQALDQRGQARRTLIVCPAGLCRQWQEEMEDKFGCADQGRFEILGRDFLPYNPRVWDLKARAIAPIDTLKRADHKKALLENRKWHLIIFDEAHRLSAMDYGSRKVEKTQNYRLAEEIRDAGYCEALLLLSATPHQGEANHSRFKNLLRLLADDIDFTGLDELNLFSGKGRPFTELVIRTPKKDVTDAQGQRVFKGRQTHRIVREMHADEKRCYDAVAKYIRSGYQALQRLDDDDRRRAQGFVLTTFQKLNASSTAAIKAALKTRLERLRGELADREVEEQDELERLYFDERYEGERDEKDVWRDDREIIEGEIDTLERLLAMKVRRDRKLDGLLALIDSITRGSREAEREKVLIFSEYRATQRFLVEQLEAVYGRGSVVVIHGSMKLDDRGKAERDAAEIWGPLHREGALAASTTRRTSQRLFREHPRVRFLVSTEAGGEGINLQFCHICVNYDLPWNPMRVEQRVGRVYRFGQEKVVQVYNFLNQGTVEDEVQHYFEERVRRAAEAIRQVTGEDVEDVMGTLNGQLESEIDPASIYKRAMVEGSLNRQTQQQIDEAVKRAQRAFEIATQSLFRDVSSFSFGSYQRELATDLTLADLQRFTDQFLSGHGRKLQRKGGFVEFLLPDALRNAWPKERCDTATFDRDLAIRRSDAEFLALGHPIVDAMLAHVGSYDFDGLTAARRIPAPQRRGQSGLLFVFIVREQIAREGPDECLFRFVPVFVDQRGFVDDDAAELAVRAEGTATTCNAAGDFFDQALGLARERLEERDKLWDWTEAAEFLALSWVEFV